MSKFTLPESFIEQYRTTPVNWGYGALSETVFLRSYSQILEDGSKERWWQTCRRVIEAMFTIQRDHCRENRLPWNQAKAQRSAKDAYDRMFQFKWTPPGRGLARMGTPIVDRLGSMALNNCLQAQTQVLTADGYLAIKDLSGTTQVVMTEGGKWVEAEIKSFGEQALRKVTLSRGGQNKVIYATPEHRWFALPVTISQGKKIAGPRVEVTTDGLTDKMILVSTFGQGVQGVRPSPFGVARGFVFGDGTRVPGQRNSNRVHLFGEKDAALKKYFEPSPALPVNHGGGGVVFGDIPNYFYQYPDLTETKSYLYGWLSGYFAADGSVSKTGEAGIASTNRRHLEFVRDVCGILGIGSHEITQVDRTSNLTGGPSTLYKISLLLDKLPEDFFLIEEHRRRVVERKARKNFRVANSWTVVSVEETDRFEEVYCAVVPETHSFVIEGNILTGNCSAVTTEDFVGAMEFLMDASLLGVGVGYDTAGAGKHTIHNPPMSEGTYLIPDSREGWVEATRKLLLGYIHGDPLPWLDYSIIRPEGSPISSGGIAPGPEPLKILHERIHELFDGRAGESLTISDVVDVGNMIGACVVSGGNRRTALIAIDNSMTDEFLSLKDYTVNPYRQDWGWASNNSIAAQVGQDISIATLGIALNGEPGVVYPEVAQKFGRLIDPPDFKDVEAKVPNPCGEIFLASRFDRQDHKAGGELCNLCDINMNHHTDLEDFLKTVKVSFLFNKTVTLLPTHNEMTNAIILKNRRIGASLGGVADFIDNNGMPEFRKWADAGYQATKSWDKTYSEWLCVRESIRLTSLKPSGTTSTLCGESPGVHWNPGGTYYLRRVGFTKGDPVLEALKAAGYHTEQSAYVNTFEVVEFPVHSKANRADADVTAFEKMAVASEVQAWWADNAVSCTVSFDPDTEGPQIGHLLQMFDGKIKGISFLPRVAGGAYQQMPYETITEAEYRARMDQLKPLDLSALYEGASGEEAEVENFCNTDNCQLPTPPESEKIEPTAEILDFLRNAQPDKVAVT